jgi:hypothetical protein
MKMCLCFLVPRWVRVLHALIRLKAMDRDLRDRRRYSEREEQRLNLSFVFPYTAAS